MSSYRFCRTDDIGLLVDALNRCWAPYFPGQPLETTATFKRAIRDLQIWCSSCMVAFAGADPIAVLIGAKRASATLIHKIAVHPDHVRQGHGRHLLTSMSSKLAILGPPRIVAEVPEDFEAARALFGSCGYVEEAILTDYLLDAQQGADDAPHTPPGTFLIPVTVDDLAANGLLEAIDPRGAWERAAETLMARKDEIAGVALASEEQIEAYVLHTSSTGEILALHSRVGDGGARLGQLLRRLGAGSFRLPKVHPAELPPDLLDALGFRPAGGHLLYSARARSA